MRRLILLALALLLVAPCCRAEGERFTADGFSFAPPEMLVSQPVDEEAKNLGVVYAGQSEDGTLRMLAIIRGVRRSADTSVAALLARMGEGENVELTGSVTAGDTEFVLSTETAGESGREVYFRTATAVRDGKQIMLFFIDTTGAYAELPEQTAQSVQWNE